MKTKKIKIIRLDNAIPRIAQSPISIHIPIGVLITAMTTANDANAIMKNQNRIAPM